MQHGFRHAGIFLDARRAVTKIVGKASGNPLWQYHKAQKQVWRAHALTTGKCRQLFRQKLALSTRVVLRVTCFDQITRFSIVPADTLSQLWPGATLFA